MKAGLRSGKYRGVHCPFIGNVPLPKVTPITRRILIFLAIPAEHLIFDLRITSVSIKDLYLLFFAENGEERILIFVKRIK
jgi:hypothetical protein